jgi:hypothetical protein
VKLAGRSTQWTALTICALALPRAGSAQSIPSPFAFIEEKQEVGSFVGYMTASKGRFGYGPAGGLMLGGRYGLDLAGPLGLEANAGGVWGTRDVVNPARAEGDRVIGQADILLSMIDFRLRLSAAGARTWHGLSPSLSFGGGVVWDNGDTSLTERAVLDADEIFEFGTRFFAIIGPGVRWHVTRRIAVRTDLGFSLWRIDTPAGFGDPALGFESVAESEWVSGLALTGSVLFRW